MKILYRGNFNNGNFPMEIVCQRIVDRYGFSYGDEKDFCGSTLEIEASDVKKHPWSKYPDFKGVDYGVICPVCGKFIPVPESQIPNKVLKDAEEISISTK